MGFNSLEGKDGAPMTVEEIKQYIEEYTKPNDYFVVCVDRPNYTQQEIVSIGHACMMSENEPNSHYVYLSGGFPRPVM